MLVSNLFSFAVCDLGEVVRFVVEYFASFCLRIKVECAGLVGACVGTSDLGCHVREDNIRLVDRAHAASVPIQPGSKCHEIHLLVG